MGDAHQLAAWTRQNPAPDLDRLVAANGGPTAPDLADCFDDEERRFARKRYEEARAEWLKAHPVLVAEYAAVMQAWEARRGAVSEKIKGGAQRRGGR